MAFRGLELSRSKGSPIELFRFRYGAGPDDAYCYTNAEQARVHQGETYWPAPIKRGKLASSSEDMSKASLEINMPGNSKVAELFRVTAPAGNINVTLFQGHSRDPANEFLAIWTGRITLCTWEDNGNQVKLACEHVRSQLRRLALRRHYQYMCPHVLYGDQCRASETAATTMRNVQVVDGRLVTLNVLLGQPELYLGGMLKWTDSRGAMQARTILNTDTFNGLTRFSLSGVATDLVPGASVATVRGCSHSLEGCKTHNNVGNFGGQPFIPSSNPLGINGAFG